MVWAFDQKAPPVPKLVLLALADHAHDNGVCWPGLLGLASKTSLTRRTLLRHLNTLKRLGLVKVEPRHDRDGRQRSNLFRLPVASNGEGVSSDTPGCQQCHGEGVSSDTGEGVSTDTQNHNIEPSYETILSGKPDTSPANDPSEKARDSKNGKGTSESIPYEPIVDYLNEQADTHYKPTTRMTCDFIKARWKEGFREKDFKRVIDNMVADWGGDSEWEKYLRPETLFGTKFESYLNRKPDKSREATIYVPANA